MQVLMKRDPTARNYSWGPQT